jgi:hypothetical protein
MIDRIKTLIQFIFWFHKRLLQRMFQMDIGLLCENEQ